MVTRANQLSAVVSKRNGPNPVQDVYAWAGEFWTVNISKEGHLFASSVFIVATLKDLLQRSAAESYLQRTDRGLFASKAGFLLREINAAHPFREGNGRVQREFIRELGLHAGFVIDLSYITRDQMTAASRGIVLLALAIAAAAIGVLLFGDETLTYLTTRVGALTATAKMLTSAKNRSSLKDV